MTAAARRALPHPALSQRESGGARGRLAGADWELCELAEAEALLGRLDAGCGFLSEEEAEACRALRTTKRRLDWLAGRLAAKRLVKRSLGGTCDAGDCASKKAAPILLSDIRILNDASGAPFVRLPWPEPRERRPISITHSGLYAACALSAAGGLVGADLETVAERDPAWLGIARHDLERFPDLESDPEAQTALWTIKESVLKLLGVGLSVDLWEVRLIPDAGGRALYALGPARLELHGRARSAWEALGRPRLEIETAAVAERTILSAAASC